MNRFSISNPLLVTLYQQMTADGLSAAALATRLHVSPAYLSQLLTGERAIKNAGDALLRAAAAYLELPVVTVFLLSGRLQVTDWYAEPGALESALDEAIRQVAASRQAMDFGVVASDLLQLPTSHKLLIVELFSATAPVAALPERSTAKTFEKLLKSTPAKIQVNKI